MRTSRRHKTKTDIPECAPHNGKNIKEGPSLYGHAEYSIKITIKWCEVSNFTEASLKVDNHFLRVMNPLDVTGNARECRELPSHVRSVRVLASWSVNPRISSYLISQQHSLFGVPP
ncbi:hypothetical protein CDAR_468431 [Caerostris darwini]|uniref:Uncharacterized protein n=1 Tax=Caerostris darwini TaxID=1538125 RepID=A0AAV4Q1V2_9ARAC|nr:hypothetical protein CDAR_468431 [Caerostris darwini]